MNPSPNRQAVVVGLFVVAALAILAGGILAVGNIRDTFSRKITISAVFPEVNGLQAGDNIWFSGLKVGTVKSLAFSDGSEVAVEMKIDELVTAYIHADALAKVSSDGLIGNRIVVIYGGTPEAAQLADGAVLGIGETVSTEEVMAMLQENNSNLLEITADLKGVVHKVALGEGTVGKLLGEDALYTDASATIATLKDASAQAQDAIGDLKTFAGDLNRPGGLAHELVTDRTTLPELKATIHNTSANLDRVGDKAVSLVDGVQASLNDAGTPVGALLHDAELRGDLKTTLENLDKSSALLAVDLQAVQHNFLFRPFFRKQERAAEKAKKEAEKAQ